MGARTRATATSTACSVANAHSRSVRGRVAAHAVAGTAQVPRGEVGDERADRACRVERVVRLQVPLHLAGESRRPRQDPPVERRPAVRVRDGGTDPPPRHPFRKARIRHEERVHVPQHEQFAPGLVGRMPAEQDVVLGPRAREHPAHHVDAHPLGGVVELDRVAPALVHGTAVLAEERAVAEDRAEGRLAPQHRAHREQRVEPVAELAREALGDEVGREPLPPVRRVLAEVHRGERHDPGVEPGVPHVADALHGSPAARARHLHRVDVRSMRGVSLEQLPALHGAPAQLLAPPHHGHRPAGRAVVDRKGQPPVALLADHPVVHVQEPVELALVPEPGDPPDPVHDLHDLVAQARVDLLAGQRLPRLVVAPGPC